MKITKIALGCSLILLCFSQVRAEVFECTVNGKTKYEANPCADTTAEKKLDIKLSDPAKNAKALEKLKELEARIAAEKEAEKEVKEKMEKEELMIRQTEAQEREANKPPVVIFDFHR